MYYLSICSSIAAVEQHASSLHPTPFYRPDPGMVVASLSVAVLSRNERLKSKKHRRTAAARAFFQQHQVPILLAVGALIILGVILSQQKPKLVASTNQSTGDNPANIAVAQPGAKQEETSAVTIPEKATTVAKLQVEATSVTPLQASAAAQTQLAGAFTRSFELTVYAGEAAAQVRHTKQQLLMADKAVTELLQAKLPKDTQAVAASWQVIQNYFHAQARHVQANLMVVWIETKQLHLSYRTTVGHYGSSRQVPAIAEFFYSIDTEAAGGALRPVLSQGLEAKISYLHTQLLAALAKTKQLHLAYQAARTVAQKYAAQPSHAQDTSSSEAPAIDSQAEAGQKQEDNG